MNEFEKACREWMKGCSVAANQPEDCAECTAAFRSRVSSLVAMEESEEAEEAITGRTAYVECGDRFFMAVLFDKPTSVNLPEETPVTIIPTSPTGSVSRGR